MRAFAVRLLLALFFLAPLAQESKAQSTGRVVADCTIGVPLAYAVGSTSLMTMLATGAACTSGGGGGGGGLSVTDSAAWAVGVSQFTPGGGFYNSSQQTLTSGQQGTFALSSVRSLFIDTPATNSNLYSAVTAPVPCKAAATWNASTALTGTNPSGCNGSAALYVDLASINNAAMSATNPLFSEITDGTNTASVKAASTLPAATDKSLVVGINPGSATAGSPTGAILTVQGVASGKELPVNQTQIGGTAIVADPCQANTKLTAAFSQTSSGTVITGTSAKKNYICSLAVIASAARQLSLVEYSGTCTGGTPYATLGSTTAANGLPLAANGGLTLGNGGATVISGGGNTNTAYNVCLLQNGAGTAAGTVTYVQQ